MNFAPSGSNRNRRRGEIRTRRRNNQSTEVISCNSKKHCPIWSWQWLIKCSFLHRLRSLNTMNIRIFWNVTSCCLVDIYQRFSGMRSIRLQDRKFSRSLIIFWRIFPLLGNGSVNTFPQKQTLGTIERSLLGNGPVNKHSSQQKTVFSVWSAQSGYK
jgi:hypothetical protein